MYNPLDLAGKRILVTGASSGIGRACAVMASKLGANVILIARRKDALEETLGMMDGNNHLILPMDLSNCGEIARLAQGYDFKVNKINGLVHAAGVMEIIPLAGLRESAFLQTMTVNCVSYIELARIFSKKIYSCDKASFVAISSTASAIAWKGGVAYCASKAALDAATRVMALELSHRQLRFNTVQPSYVRTDMVVRDAEEKGVDVNAFVEQNQPLGLGEVDDVAHAVCFLLSDASRFITGTNLVVDGGYLAQ